MTKTALAFLSIITLWISFAPARARSQAPIPDFKFDIVSITPTKLGPQDPSRFQYLDDGIVCDNVSLLSLVQDAYGIYGHDRILGIPSWLNSEHFNVEAKLDSNAADKLQKLTKAQRGLVWQQMLQALLADRIMLTVHKETRELPVFFLVLAGSGFKLQESKPDPANPNATDHAVFVRETVTSAGSIKSGKWFASSDIASWLRGEMGRTVLDKTGLTGRYDFSLQYSREQDQLQSAPGETAEGQPDATRSDFAFPGLLTAIRQQLGLKLESGKGPVEVIVIDHVERPSGN